MLYPIRQLEYKDKIPYVSIRDYNVKEHIKRNKTLRVVYKDEYMDLTPKQLKKHEIVIDKTFRSQFYPDQTYKLYSYEFKPTKRISKEDREKQLLGL